MRELRLFALVSEGRGLFVLVVGVPVRMWMGVYHAPVRVTVSMNEICLQQKVMAGQDGSRGAVSKNGASVQNQNPIGDVLNDVELMRGGQHCFRGAFPLLDQIHELTRRLGVERGSRFVEQQYFWVQKNDRCERNALLLAT